MSAAWLTAPIALTGSRMFTCDMFGFTPEQCAFYQHRWHFWFIADYVFALPTLAFFLTGIGIFLVANLISSQLLGYRRVRGPAVWRKLVAVVRYLSYRTYHVQALRWDTAPLGVLLLGAAGTVYFFCMDLIPQPYYWSSSVFGSSPPLATRSGWMALGCMPFVFATASKTNWITLLTGVSHERLQVFHRWISYAFFVLALMHTFPFIIFGIRNHDLVAQVTSSLIFYWTGIVAIIFQAWLTFASHSVIRNLGYEFFKATHIFAVVIFVVVFFWHCDYTLTSWHYFIGTAAVYVPCYVFPWLRTAFEYGFSQKAYLHVEENGFTRIVIPAVNMRWKPGQHCFLRFTSFGLHAFSSHPFTICSLPSMNANEKSELVFYVRHQRGLTERLYKHALQNPGASIPILVDGPYGGINMQRFLDGDRLLVVAGGSGAGWIIPFVELFQRRIFASAAADDENSKSEDDQEGQPMRGLQERTNLRVVLATREISSRIWFLRAVSERLSKYPISHIASSLSSSINIEIHLTGDAEQAIDLSKVAPNITVVTAASTSSSEDIQSKTQGDSSDPPADPATATSTLPLQELYGRPSLPDIVRDEAARAATENQSLSVFVCGPHSMQSDVSNAVARENLDIARGVSSSGSSRSASEGVYLHTEHFSWA